MPTVDISGNTYEVYADIASADLFLAGDIFYSSKWSAASNKAEALVSATRWLDRKRWLGTKTAESQPLEWPRTGVEGEESDTVPTAIANACCLLAGLLVTKPKSAQTKTTASNRKQVMAGQGVGIEYFRPDDGEEFPAQAMEMVQHLLASQVAIAIPFVGACTESHFAEERFTVGG